jgi:DNA-binding NarL/FixJ family response regulator
MDAMMPGMDGFEACRQLRRQSALAHVPIIFMTGLTDTEDVVKGFEAGGVDYVTKPIIPEELIARIRVHLNNARRSHSARAALDVSGRVLLAADRSGKVLWYTPQASKMLANIIPDLEHFTFPVSVQGWLQAQASDSSRAAAPTIGIWGDAVGSPLRLQYIGQISADEHLLRLVESDAGGEELTLRTKLALTQREAEVLLWIARGKSNRDIGQILNLSPRTVNKHLEQVYAKLGVENRTSAAAMALRAIGMD